MTATRASAPVGKASGYDPGTEHAAPQPSPRRSVDRGRALRTTGFHLTAGLLSALWLLPIALVLVTSTRTFDDIAAHGVGSWPHSFTLDGFRQAWVDGGQQQALINSMVVSVPTVLLSLGLASMAAFGLSRYDLPFRRGLLLLMLGGNLLPPQILLIPVSKLSEVLGIYDQLYALIGVQVGFGVGFYVFVLYGFMRAIPSEIQQAAVIDGAGAWQIYWRIILPLARPALAALSALSFTWIFNDLLWAITVLRTDSQMPITASLIGLQGQYVSMWNIIAAGSVIAAAPTVAVFLAFQRHFVAGLNLGAVK
ncbi:carbohydrate ABC transporter permease [Streptomyces sp. PmtA]|uniref:carbohydrate ABC transporter permease n=1 Tax=Streptomyces sp. PmtA TaxID=3074275 RepID=UPI0030149826